VAQAVLWAQVGQAFKSRPQRQQQPNLKGETAVAGEKIADVSLEDRARIALLQRLIKDLQGQIIEVIGNYVQIAEPRFVATPEEEKLASGKDVYVQLVSAIDSHPQFGVGCVIYIDPPGMCCEDC
jgi:hypothetical protein